MRVIGSLSTLAAASHLDAVNPHAHARQHRANETGVLTAPVRYTQAVNSTVQTATYFKANTNRIGHQTYPSVAGLSDGGYVITWCSWDQDSDGKGVFGQRFRSDGAMIGDAFPLTEAVGNQQNATVAGFSDAGFVATWSREIDGRSTIHAQSFDSNAIKTGPLITLDALDDQRESHIAVLADNTFVIAWNARSQKDGNFGVFAQRFQADGTRFGDLFQVNPIITGHEVYVKVVALSDGGFAIAFSMVDYEKNQFISKDGDWMVWVHDNHVDAPHSMNYAENFVQVYNADGSERDKTLAVSNFWKVFLTTPSIAGLSDGGFIMLHTVFIGAYEPEGIYLHRYNRDNQVVGDSHRIKTGGYPISSTITATPDGGFILSAYQLGNLFTDSDIVLQRYDALGNRVGSFIHVSSETFYPNHHTKIGIELSHAVTVLPDGGFVVVWAYGGLHAIDYDIIVAQFDKFGNPVQTPNTLNDPPQAVPVIPAQSLTVGVPWTFTLPNFIFSDPESDALDITAYEAGEMTLGAGMVFDKASQTLSWTPTDPGERSVVFKATDPQGLSATSTLQLTITGSQTPDASVVSHHEAESLVLPILLVVYGLHAHTTTG